MSKVRSYAVPHWAREREAGAQFYGFLGEVLAGTEDIRANGAAGYVTSRFHQQNQVWLRHRVRAFLANSLMWISSLGAFAVADAIVFALGAWLWHRGELSVGSVYVIFYYTELLRRPIEQIRAQLQELQTATASIWRVEELLATESKVGDGKGPGIAEGALSLEFDGVSFGYEPGEPVLKDVEFRLERGRVLGLLGRTGSGKTTLARLIFRLYDPDDGAVLLQGRNIREGPLDQLRRRVGMVTQEVQIFEATVRENLTFFDSSVSDSRLLKVIADIGLGHWFGVQPQGLDTRIAQGNLSAGEAQLLAFARLFLRDPGLVILDEASSRLDPATENLIEAAVSKLLRGRTAILIAHRLSTVERADDVLILDEGRVAEIGKRADLAADPESRLSHLLRTDIQAVLA
jgi:ATP-binding cassette subfamily B protein